MCEHKELAYRICASEEMKLIQKKKREQISTELHNIEDGMACRVGRKKERIKVNQ